MEPRMTANEAADRIEALGRERDEAETREAAAADAAVGYLSRARPRPMYPARPGLIRMILVETARAMVPFALMYAFLSIGG